MILLNKHAFDSLSPEQDILIYRQSVFLNYLSRIDKIFKMETAIQEDVRYSQKTIRPV